MKIRKLLLVLSSLLMLSAVSMQAVGDYDEPVEWSRFDKQVVVTSFAAGGAFALLARWLYDGGLESFLADDEVDEPADIIVDQQNRDIFGDDSGTKETLRCVCALQNMIPEGTRLEDMISS